MKLEKVTNRAGFTLIELLAVIGIIAILAGIVIGVSGVATRKAAESQASAQIEQMKDALEEYRLDQGTLLGIPGNTMSLTNNVFDVLTNYVSELDRIDPWGVQYEYERQGKYTYILRSGGPDGDLATDEDNITNESEN